MRMLMDIIFPETYVAKAKRYWQRRKYKKLPSSVLPRRKLPVVKLGSQSTDNCRSWRVKSTRKLKLRVLISPIRLLVKIREGYIDLMLRWAGKLGRAQVMMEVGGQQVDARLVMEIYNRMVSMRDQIEAVEHLLDDKFVPSCDGFHEFA